VQHQDVLVLVDGCVNAQALGALVAVEDAARAAIARLDEEGIDNGGAALPRARASAPLARSRVPSSVQRRRAQATVDQGGKLSGSACQVQPLRIT